MFNLNCTSLNCAAFSRRRLPTNLLLIVCSLAEKKVRAK